MSRRMGAAGSAARDRIHSDTRKASRAGRMGWIMDIYLHRR